MEIAVSRVYERGSGVDVTGAGVSALHKAVPHIERPLSAAVIDL
jgi:hypothetical protein